MDNHVSRSNRNYLKYFRILFTLCVVVLNYDVYAQYTQPEHLEFEQNVTAIDTWNVSVKSGEGTLLNGHLDVPYYHFGVDQYSDQYPNKYIGGDVTVIWSLSSDISSVSIPWTIKRIEDNGFAGCTKLKSVVIPNNVEYVGMFAFKGCTALNSVVVSPNNECHSPFSGCDIKKGAYPEGNRAFVADIEVAYPKDCIPDSLGLIFNQNASVLYFVPWMTEKIELPKTINLIESKAFAGCTRIKELKINACDPPSIIDDAFNGAIINSIIVPFGCKEKYIANSEWSRFTSIISESEQISFPEYPLSINYNSLSLRKGESILLIVNNGEEKVPGEDIVWSSGDTEVANVVDGLVTAYSVGNATIRASYGDWEIDVLVTVTDNIISVNGLYFSLHDFPTKEAYLERPPSGIYELTNYVIPETIFYEGYEYPITRIAKWAFLKDYAHIIPLQKIHLPSTLQQIEEEAFYGCYDLTEVDFSDATSLSTIGSSAFKECTGLKNIILPNSIETIQSEAFSDCENLEEINLGTNLKLIAGACFYGCSSIREIELPPTVETIEAWAFRGCTSLKNVNMGDMVSQIGNRAFRNCSSLQQIYLSNSLTKIEEETFLGCTALKSIKIPKSIQSIGDHAFGDCINLEYIDLPFNGDLNWLGNYAFENCSKLSSFIIPPKCIVYSSYYPFNGCNGIIKAAYPSCNKQNPFPSGLSIQYDTTNPIFENDIIYDDQTIFYAGIESELDAQNLKSFKKIGNYALAKCNLINVNNLISDKNLEYIGAYAFYDSTLENCDSLKIGGNVVYIGNHAFERCKNLKHLIIEEGNQDVTIGAFAFKETSIQSIYLGHNFINKNYEYDAMPFSANEYLEYLKIGPQVTLIGAGSFAKCENLKTVIIEDCAEILEFHYGFNVFGESPIETLYLGRDFIFDKYYYQSDHPFKTCETLRNLYIGSLVSILQYSDFDYCTSLQNIYILDGKDLLDIKGTIPSDNLKNLQIGRNLHCVEATELLINKSNLENIWITDRVNRIDNFKFSNCPNLKNVYIGDGITTIYKNLISECSSLNILDIGAGVERIQSLAFHNCGDIASIYVRSQTPPALNIGAFDDEIFNFSKLHIPSSSTYLSSEIWENFNWTSNKFEIEFEDKYLNATSGDTITLTLRSNGDFNLNEIKILSSNPAVAEIVEEPLLETDADQNNGLVDMTKRSFKIKISKNEKVTIAAFAKTGQMAKSLINFSPSLIESITIDADTNILKNGKDLKLNVDILPATATNRHVTWSSSDDAIAKVDSCGVVSAISPGHVAITATAVDGSNIACTFDLTVLPLLKGDSNGNDEVTVADAINTANYAVGNEVEYFYFEVADVNEDNNITLSDATGTIEIVLNQINPSNGMVARRIGRKSIESAFDYLLAENIYRSSDNDIVFDLKLVNASEYVALQADMSLSEGMTIEKVEIGPRAKLGHSLMYRMIDDNSVRIALFNFDNRTFADNDEAILKVFAKSNCSNKIDISLCNILAVDKNSNEYLLPSKVNIKNESTGVDDIDSYGTISIIASEYGLNVYNAEGRSINIFTADGAKAYSFKALSNAETVYLVKGVYVVIVGEKSSKIIVK